MYNHISLLSKLWMGDFKHKSPVLSRRDEGISTIGVLKFPAKSAMVLEFRFSTKQRRPQ